MQKQNNISKYKKPRANGRLTFIAKHMGITLASLYKYRKGIWTRPFDYDERLAAAEAAWDELPTEKKTWRNKK